MSTTFTESSGNVFADLGFEPAEAVILENAGEANERPARVYPIKRDDPASSDEEAKDCSIESVRPDARQLGGIQPGNADHAGCSRRLQDNAGTGRWTLRKDGRTRGDPGCRE